MPAPPGQVAWGTGVVPFGAPFLPAPTDRVVRAEWAVSHVHSLGVVQSGGAVVSRATVVSFGCRAGALATAVRVELQRRVVHGLWSPVAEWAAPSDGDGRVRCGHTHAVDPAIENYWRLKALVVSGMECNR